LFLLLLDVCLAFYGGLALPADVPLLLRARVRVCSKIVRKGIARVHTVYRQNIRTALRKKIENDGANKKGKVRTSYAVCWMLGCWLTAGLWQHGSSRNSTSST
jgi:hypothetical protein